MNEIRTFDYTVVAPPPRTDTLQLFKLARIVFGQDFEAVPYTPEEIRQLMQEEVNDDDNNR